MPLTLVTLEDFNEAIATLNTRITELMSATQDDINALTGQVQQISADLRNTHDKLQSEIDVLAQQGVDVSALRDALEPLDSQVVALGNIEPTPTPIRSGTDAAVAGPTDADASATPQASAVEGAQASGQVSE